MPSASPTRNTASHSSPFAACSVASVTPSAAGACCALARASSSATRSGSRAAGSRAARSSARATSAASDSQRARTAPLPAGGSADQPAAVEHRPDLIGQLGASRQPGCGVRPVALGPGCAAQQRRALLDLGAVEEPLEPAHDVRDAGAGQRLLVRLRLGVDPEQHRDVTRRRAGRDERSDRGGDAVGLGRLVGVLGERWLRTWPDLASASRTRARAIGPRALASRPFASSTTWSVER